MSIVFNLIKQEEERQANTIQLIASENFVSEDIKRAMGSCLTNKYSEGYPGARYYGGCEIVDKIESYCQQKWQEVFKTDYHVNVQPHSGSQANFAAYMAVLKPRDRILAMDLKNGGHLTHGSHVNFSGKFYNTYFYNLDKDGFIDYDDLAKKIEDLKPQLIVAGASAYSRFIDYKKIYNIIQEKKALLSYSESLPNGDDYEVRYEPYFMVDMAHVAGLIAGGVHPSPFGYADIITTTTHKTLRGPRGGLIFCRPELAKQIDSAVFPGSQGGPLQHVIAAKAICAEEALKPEFTTYAQKVVCCANAMASRFRELGYDIVTNGTDNHMFLLDLSKTNLSGSHVEKALETEGIIVNKNCVPNEKRSPRLASGIRIGTAAMVTKGWDIPQFIECADKIDKIIQKEKMIYIRQKAEELKTAMERIKNSGK